MRGSRLHKIGVKPGSATSSAAGTSSRWQWLVFLPLLVVLSLVFLAYSNILFNFFVGDDFVHLAWLRQAIQSPELIWRNFHTSWLEIPTTKFYRPLISVFMVGDYLLWKTNGFGFHLTNLLFLFASTIILYCIVLALTDSQRRFSIWATATALIFGLYPLHPEAVSWITGRVDDIVTTFYLASLLCYVSLKESPTPAGARTVRRILRLALTATFMILALLSKEMAITLPALLAVYSFIYEFTGQPLLKRLTASALNSLPYWLILVGYFAIRRAALGTFVGGYDDSLFYISNVPVFVAGWLQGMRMFLIPINRTIVTDHSVLTYLWEGGLALSFLLVLCRVIKHADIRRHAFFLGAWLALALAPVYKIFSIAKDLQGSRLAFLATVPLAALLALGLAVPFRRQPLRMASLALAVIMPALCFVLLESNNTAWQASGLQANALRTALNRFYLETPGDPQTLISGLPDQYKGAYVARNSLDGMTKAPQLCRDIFNCVALNDSETVLPFGYLKSSLRHNWSKVFVLRWQPQSQVLERLPIPVISSDSPPRKFDLKGKLTAGTDSILTVRSSAEAELSADNPRRRPEVLISVNLPCYSTDFIAVDATIDGAIDGSGADLLFSNAAQPELDYESRIHCDVAEKGKQRLIFSLRGSPKWSLGESSRKLALRFPAGSTVRINQILPLPARQIMPSIQFQDSGYLGCKGFLHLSPKHACEAVLVDATAVPGAHGFTLEITRPNLFFQEQNSSSASKICMREIDGGAAARGSVILSCNTFPAQGLYQARAWAVDAAHRKLGVAGDHIVVSVDP